MLNYAELSKQYSAFAVSLAVNLKNRTPKRPLVGKTVFEAVHGRKTSFKDLRVFGYFPFVHVPKEKHKKHDYRATHGIFVAYSISTKQCFVYDPLTRTLQSNRDVVSRERKWYTAPNTADEAIINELFSREVFEEPKPIEK